MPIVLQVDELEPGMVLASNVTNEYCVLLARGRRLNEYDIRALQRKLPEVLVQVVDPVLDEAVEFDSTTADQQVSLAVRRNIATVVKHVSQGVRQGVALEGENVAGMQAVIEQMLAYLQENPVTMAIVEQSGRWGDYLQEHSANVFYLSVVVGNTIRNYIKQQREKYSLARTLSNAMDLTPLATAAMFHDIGMVPIEHVYRKEGPLTEEEKRQVWAHPERGAAMLPEEIDAMARLIVRTHHEDFDGTGYPQGLKGEAIPVFSRIVRVADAYAAGITSTAYRSGKSSVRVLYEMLYGTHEGHYDPAVLKVFASITQPLPVGAKVRLEDGRWAVIVGRNRSDPFKPRLVVAYDELGDPLGRDELIGPFALGERADVRVASFRDEDLSFLNDLGPWREARPAVAVEREYEGLLDFIYP